MSARYLAALALALLAGTAGYVTHQISRQVPPIGAPADLSSPPATTAAAGSGTPSEKAPLAWSFKNIDGTQTALSSWLGQVLVVNFWATWCPPCLHEIPVFIELQQRHAPAGLQVVGIALDQLDAVQPFVTEHGLNYPILLGDDDVARYMLTLGNDIGALPFTVVFARDGQIALTHRGEWAADAAAAALNKLLAGPRAAPEPAAK